MKFLSNLFAGLGIFAILAWFCLIAAGIYGYIANILIIVSSLAGPASELTLIMAVRIVGVFAFPLGAILGYF